MVRIKVFLTLITVWVYDVLAVIRYSIPAFTYTSPMVLVSGLLYSKQTM